jgi:hypothetical protein
MATSIDTRQSDFSEMDNSGISKRRRDDVDFITLTYLVNEALDPVTVREIESHKDPKASWRVYGLGQLGEVEGKIYKDWQIILDIPHQARLERYGLDFGYSNDPGSLISVYTYNGGYILDQIGYQKGISNRQIADTLWKVQRALVTNLNISSAIRWAPQGMRPCRSRTRYRSSQRLRRGL